MSRARSKTKPAKPTEAQLQYLERLGYEGKLPTTRADASWQISHLKARRTDFGTMTLRGPAARVGASERQIQILRRLGYEGPSDISSADAVRLHSYLRQITSSE